jgi:hypothetical protein
MGTGRSQLHGEKKANILEGANALSTRLIQWRQPLERAVTFGLVSIPVRLYRAARAEKISFRQLHRMA